MFTFTTIVAAVILTTVVTATNTTTTTTDWTKITPGGPTLCSKGAPFSFYYRKGSVNKLVVELQGGGACWNSNTCALGTFTTTCSPPGSTGVHSSTDSRNPFQDWNHLFIPYCTADAHGGNQTTEYSSIFGKFKIHHFGRVNAFAAMDYAFALPENTNPTTVSTIGCSAGSLGAIVNVPYVNAQYPSSKHMYFGDSYVGVISNQQFGDGIANWDLQFSPNVPGLDKANLERVAANKSIDAGLYIVNATITSAPDDCQFASYTSNDDAVQSSFYTLGGGIDWPNHMRHLTETIHSIHGDQYSTYIAPGFKHCRTQDDGVYDVVSDKIKLSDWMTNFVNGKIEHRQVDCKVSNNC
jgi:hypothetical protein